MFTIRALLFKLPQCHLTSKSPLSSALLRLKSPLPRSPPASFFLASESLLFHPSRSLASSTSTTPSDLGQDYPTGESEIEEFGRWRRLGVKLRLFFALPWERVEKGSVLKMQLRGKISDQLWTRFSSGLSLPQICENFTKALYDPRISGIYLHIEPLNCGWGKLDEIRRHIMNFKKSGKFIVSYMPICGEKEYYLACACGELYVPPSAYIRLYGLTVQSAFLGGVLEKVGVHPEVQRIGKYKSLGDQLTQKSMSTDVREMLNLLLDNIYENWLEIVSLSRGKRMEEIVEFLNSGVYQVEKLKEEGWITNIMYDDEVMSMLKERVGQKNKKKLLMVDYSKYARVRKSTLSIDAGKDNIAIIRACGNISRTARTPKPLSHAGSGIIAEQLIKKIRAVRDSGAFKAVILRIDSSGGDALASDLVWREIKLLAASKLVIASMSDIAASGGYYLAMAAGTIVAEKLTLTGSIGVVRGRFSLNKLYGKIDFNKEILSRGQYAELNVAEQRSLRPDEAEHFAKATQYAYTQFRDKAALSRSMTVDQMEKVAQGRVWTGKDAASRGLVDAIGGMSRAVAIAKQKANIPHDRQVRLVELSRPSTTLPDMLSSIWNSVFGLDMAVKEVLQDLAPASGVQARTDGILLEAVGSASEENHVFDLIKDCLGSS
ncbi:serine protease SPPA, chloroplastic-like isoform X1 [Canna indica]|uniref:Serine protease SPPA, chloroplastic-like isoform X1 n=1 Tax=Canna indica TaxID=4628 RepID=A0AAQ3L162_9LILI|nr:serine protease SPPA, chloroplastic-like isoform X1 [Canna indica]